MLSSSPAEFNKLENLANILITADRQNRITQQYFFIIDPVRLKAIAINGGLHTQDCTMKFHSSLCNSISKKSQHSGAIVDFEAADNCRLYVTTMRAMSFQDDSPTFPIGKIGDHYALVFDLNSRPVATKKVHYAEPLAETLTLEINLTFLLEHAKELIALG